MRKKRNFTTLNLSFLDIMSCGFGAVILIFLIIDHNSEVHAEEVNEDLISEVSLLEEEILDGREHLVVTRNTIEDIDNQIVEANGLAAKILSEKQALEVKLSTLDKAALDEIDRLNQLKSEIQSLEEETRRLKAKELEESGTNSREFIGDGDRQYLTGLKLGGERTLIALDNSASMLDRSIVNIIRMRNMNDSEKYKSEKWTQARGIVEWLVSQLPNESQYQIYTFNLESEAVISGTKGSWLSVSNSGQLNQAIDNVNRTLPENGTSLENLFIDIAAMSPRPDNIILITDGLPTQGTKVRSGTVSGRDRERIFNRAVGKLPRNIPVNIILTPLEGDPMAASAYWKLALATKGAFLAPSRDWP